MFWLDFIFAYGVLSFLLILATLVALVAVTVHDTVIYLLDKLKNS